MLKNKKFTKILIAILVVLLGGFLRFYKYEHQVPFDWDQNRDYGVISNIARGNMTLIGPIAKGDGGFFLGPLYYYLVLPTYLLKSGDPLSLPITSILIDISMIIAIIYLLSKRIGWGKAIVLSFLWSTSWFLIGWSRVSWNVAIVPIWSLATMVTLYDCLKSKQNYGLLILGLLAGFSWHIHASLIPLIPILVAIYFKKLKYGGKIWLSTIAISFIPLLPLFIFDLRHDFLNIHLIQNYFNSNTTISLPSIWQIINDVVAKLGKNTVGIFTGSFTAVPLVGYGILVLSFWKLFQKDNMNKIASLIIISLTILSISLRDMGFPEYYLSAAYFPIIFIVIDTLINIFKGNRYILVTLFGIFIYLNISKYSTFPSSYAYANKINVVKEIAKLNKSVDVRYELSFGREGGLIYLLEKEGVNVREGADTQIVITDKVDSAVNIGGSPSYDLVRAGSIKAAVRMLE